MGLLSRAENAYSADADNIIDGNASSGDASQQVPGKATLTKKNLSLLKKKISEYQKVYRIFGCIVLEGKDDFSEKLARITSEVGTTNPIDHDHALILLPAETDRELIAHRLSKSLNAVPILSFRATSPEYVIDRIGSMS